MAQKKFALAILVVALLFVVALIALIQCRVMTYNVLYDTLESLKQVKLIF